MDMVQVYASVATIIFSLEIVQAIARFYTDLDDSKQKKAISSTGLWFIFSTFVLFCVFSVTFSTQLSSILLKDSTKSEIVRVATFSVAANGLFYYLQSQLRWDFKSIAYAIASIVTVLCSAVSTIFFILVLKLGVVGTFYGQILGSICGSVVSFACNRNVYGFCFNAAMLRKMLVFSVPLIPSSLGVVVTGYIDRISIQQLMTLADVGVYGIGSRFASIASLLLIGFNSALTPLIYGNYRKPETAIEISRIFTMFSFISFSFIGGFVLFSDLVVRLMTARAYWGSATVMPFLISSAIVTGAYVFIPGLAIAKKTIHIAAINITCMAWSIIVNFTIIPLLGILGAAIANLSGAVLGLLLYIKFSQPFYAVIYEWRRIVWGLILLIPLAFFQLVLSRLIYGLAIATLAKIVLWIAFVFIIKKVMIPSISLRKIIIRLNEN